jgi:GT2 family glycosyltransferase
MSVNMAVARSVLENVGGFDTRLGLKSGSDNPHIGGEDSFLALRAKRCGYSILYQPTAVVYHPVTSERLTRRFFLRRNFREGVTALAIKNIEKACTKQELVENQRLHVRRLVVLIILFCKDFMMPRKGWSRACMLRACEMAFSIGLLRHARLLRKILSSKETTGENRS